MKLPFELKISDIKTVNVEQAEVQHVRSKDNKGGYTFVTYLIDGKMYGGYARCSKKDNFNKRYGRTLAQFRLINNYRKRNGIKQIQNYDLVYLVSAMEDLIIKESILNKTTKNEYNVSKIKDLENEITGLKRFINIIWKLGV